MNPARKEYANGQMVEEYYWNGRMIVYIDNKLSGETFDDAVSRLRSAELEAGAEGREIEAEAIK